MQNVWEVYTVCAENHGGGGFFGGILSFELARVLGRAGSFIVILALFLLFFMLLSKKLIFSSIQQMYKSVRRMKIIIMRNRNRCILVEDR